jgi:hypothetical protein
LRHGTTTGTIAPAGVRASGCQVRIQVQNPNTLKNTSLKRRRQKPELQHQCEQAEHSARPVRCCNWTPRTFAAGWYRGIRDYFFFLAGFFLADFLAAFLAMFINSCHFESDARSWGIGHAPLRHPSREATASKHSQVVNSSSTLESRGLRHDISSAYIEIRLSRQAQLHVF